MKSQNHLKYLNNSKIIAQTKKKLFAFLHQSYIVTVIINIYNINIINIDGGVETFVLLFSFSTQ